MKIRAYYVLIPVLIVLIASVYYFTRHAKNRQETSPAVPSIGSIQLLNGCGIRGAATVMRDFLRSKGFDVKKTEDAPDWNYRETIVVSRTLDMTSARMAAKAIGTKNMMLLRDDARLFDVTIFIGRDYQKLVKNAQ